MNPTPQPTSDNLTPENLFRLLHNAVKQIDESNPLEALQQLKQLIKHKNIAISSPTPDSVQIADTLLLRWLADDADAAEEIRQTRAQLQETRQILSAYLVQREADGHIEWHYVHISAGEQTA